MMFKLCQQNHPIFYTLHYNICSWFNYNLFTHIAT